MTEQIATVWYQAYSPTGAQIDRTYESMLAGSQLEGFYRNDDGSISYEHAGDTEQFWDSCETITRNGRVVFLDENGDEWTADQLTFKDDDGNVITGALWEDQDRRPTHDDRLQMAARAMLAALAQLAELSEQMANGHFNRRRDYPKIEAARAAIAQAEAAGITPKE